MGKQELREKIAAMEDVTCEDCKYGQTCDFMGRENTKMLCLKGVDQTLALISKHYSPSLS